MKKKTKTKYESKGAGKRFFAVVLLIVFASVMLFGCGEENTEKEKNSAQKQEQSEGSTDNKADKGTGKNAGKKDPGEKGSDKKKKKDDGKSSKSKNKRGSKKEKTSKNKNNKGESAEKSGGSQTGNKKSASKDHKTKNQTKSKSGKTNNKTKSKAGKKNKTAKKYCWLKIQCKKLKGRKDLDPGTKSLVPKSGYILKKKKMEIKKGETVYSLITKARDKYRFALNVQDTAFGKYIAGIAGIEEKACGDESGWKYNVNGKYPDKSCSAVKVKAGDSIEWVYVLKANQK